MRTNHMKMSTAITKMSCMPSEVWCKESTIVKNMSAALNI